MLGIMNSFNRSLHGHSKRKRNFLQMRITALKLTFFIAIIFMASILLLILQVNLLRQFLHWMGIENAEIRWWIGSLRWVVIIGLIYFAIGLIYRIAPSLKHKWSINSPGSILATTLIIILMVLFSFWVNNFGTYNKVYGSIGTLIIIMLSFYLNSLILLMGFELNVSISHLKVEYENRQENKNEPQPG